MPTLKTAHKTSTKPATHRLSNRSREILEACAKVEIKRLETLHWAVLPFLRDAKTKAERTGQTKVLAAIAADSRKVETAISELNHTYEMQFPEGRRAYRRVQKLLKKDQIRK